MCRFLCYSGQELILSELLYQPNNSLILQSYKAKERKEPLNGDGFGIGWYDHNISQTPCVFKSLTPAWSNQNLRQLSEHVKASCFFAHVRAASPGMLVSEVNCHPFNFGRYLWMHNGTIEGFRSIKRRLQESLPDPLYHAIEGTTDSEHSFAVFLHLLGNTDDTVSAKTLGNTLAKTIQQLEQWRAEAGLSSPSYYNFAVTDGRNVAAVRYVTDAQLEPVSLYYSARGKYQCCDGVAQIVNCHPCEQGIIIASERLTERKIDWMRVAPNHVITVDADLNVDISLITHT